MVSTYDAEGTGKETRNSTRRHRTTTASKITSVKLVLYYCDAFAWKYICETNFMTGFWHERRPLRTVLGPAPAILPTLLTGQPPQRTGIWSDLIRRDRKPSRLARLLIRTRLLLAPVNLARLALARVVKRASLRVPLQLAHFFARHDATPSVASIADRAAESGLRCQFRRLKPGYDIVKEVRALDQLLESHDVLLFHDPSLAGRGRRRGADPATLREELRQVELFCASVWLRIGRDPDAQLLLVSGHGQTDVRETFDLFAALAPWRHGRDYLVSVEATMARFWYADEQVRAAIRDALRDAPGSFLTRHDEVHYGIAFDDDRFGQDVFVADEAVVLHWRRRLKDRATHGWRPECPSSYGIYCRRGAGSDPLDRTPMPVTGVFEVATKLMRPEKPRQPEPCS
jgi:hypothetical protein